MKPAFNVLFALGLCAALTTPALPASAAPKAAPTLRVSKKRANAVCRDVTRAPTFEKQRRRVVEGKDLTRTQTLKVAREICRFYAASPKKQARYWQQTLTRLVEDGKLTTDDRAVLSQALRNPEVLATWTPDTDFGRLVLGRGSDDDSATYEANSGAGWVVGGILGGIAGGLMTGGNPAGIGAGIAVGGAAGSLAETVLTDGEGDEGDSTEDGGDGDGGDGE